MSKRGRAAEVAFDPTLQHKAELLAREQKTHELTQERLDYFNREYSAENAFVMVRKLEEAEELTEGGIVKPKNLRTHKAQVVLVGPGEYNGESFTPVTQKIGQIVLVTKHGGTDVELEGEEFSLVHYKQIYLTKKKVEKA